MFREKHKVSKRRIKLIRLISILCSILALLFAGASYFVGANSLFFFLIIVSVIFILSYRLTLKRKPTLARLIFIITLNLSVAVTASYFGKGSSIEFFLVYSIGLAFVLFSFRREMYLVIIFVTLSIGLWVALYLSNFGLFYSGDIDAASIKNVIYPLSITFTLLLVAFQMSYYSYINANFNNNVHYKKQEAIDASNAKSEFLSTISHEIRTPLNAVIGLSHILGDNNPREDQKENIEALNYSGKILLNLLNNVLDFSKMQSTSIELDEIPTDLYIAIKQIKKIHEAACLKKGIIMNLEIEENIPAVWLDVVRFNQVINNLVTNAIKFTENGSVTVRIKKINKNDKEVTISTEIIDTGIGIPEDKKDTIWEAFTQASSETNRLYGGTGLGLPIVKSIVEAMNSTIKIDSEIGKGSRFYFKIHLKIAADEDLHKTTERNHYNLANKKVLLVEDNLINVMVAQQILEKEKLIVSIAYDGLEAVNMVKENKYDIVLMDIQMPIMDGYTASKEIRKFDKNIPILAISASVFMELKDRINESGMNGFIFKPFDPEDLLHQIEATMNT